MVVPFPEITPYADISRGEEKIERCIMHYTSSQSILIVGDGDFSFSLCLAKAFGSASNIVATSLDSIEMVIKRHRNASTNLEQLKEKGCFILHDVDAEDMSTDYRLMVKVSRRRREILKFDRIIFNFPHAGFVFSEHDCRQIKLHQDLVKGFFESAHRMLESDGEVHVTHKTTYPFSEWGIENLAEDVGLCLVEKVGFSRYDYPGYINKRGSGHKSDKTFPVGECSTFKFAKGLHQDLVKGFFESAHRMLESDWEVHVTHKTTYPFSEWGIENLAEDVGPCLVEKVGFSRYDGLYKQTGEWS